ncbi:MAG: response regulator [Phycisphaerae bacterium]
MAQPDVKVLMVDDDEDDFVIVRDLLRDADPRPAQNGHGQRYVVTWAPTYAEGLQKACDGTGGPDVVLVDYRLGAGDGIAFTREMVSRGCKAPVILLTGENDRAIDFAAMAAGAADFLSKTHLTADLIERALRYAVAARKAEEQRLSLLAERAARAELESANRAKDEFLAMLSHELRTPLMPVLMTVSALEKDPQFGPRLADELATIRRNVQIQGKLIDDLLDLTRVGRGKLELEEELVDLHELIEQAYQTTCAADPKAARLKCDKQPAARRHHVWGDRARLTQVLWNLLKNAVKFTPEGGRVLIRTDNPTTGGIAITVSDTGVGIDPANLTHIFSPFEQGGRNVTKTFGGLGLGLAICKAIVELHGGTIRADSDGQDKGATFTVTLPVTTAPDAESIAPQTDQGGRGVPTAVGMPEPEPATEPHPLRVLLVEDNLVTLKVMSRLFRDFGYEVTPAPDVASAHQAAHGHRFDLVVSDLGLPDGDGLSLMRQLRDQYGLKGIALSGYGQDEDVRESRAAGFVEHLVKPVDFARLEAAVRRAVSS